MSTVSRALAVLLVVLTVAVGGAFAFADFGVARSAATGESSVSAAWGNGTTLDLSEGLYVHVVGDTVADREFEADLVDEFRVEGVDAVAVSELRESYDRPVVVVGHTAWHMEYTPTHGHGEVNWRYLYVQSGNLSQFGSTTPAADDFSADRLGERLTTDGFPLVVFTDGESVIADGTLAVVDDTRGVLTLAHYDRHLRASVAERTVESVLELGA